MPSQHVSDAAEGEHARATIERLQAENERLRRALKQIGFGSSYYPNKSDPGRCVHGDSILRACVRCLKATARAALARTEAKEG